MADNTPTDTLRSEIPSVGLRIITSKGLTYITVTKNEGTKTVVADSQELDIGHLDLFIRKLQMHKDMHIYGMGNKPTREKED